MKYKFLLFLFIGINIHSQDYIYLDNNGKLIDEVLFQKKWRNTNLMFSRWDSIGKDNKRYAKINQNLYQSGISDYKLIKQQLENITDSKIPENPEIILTYIPKGDLCNNDNLNYWSRSKINRRKRWLKPWLKKFEDKNLYYVWLFENGITLKTKPNLENEFFFTDKDNFFKEKIFISKAMCGSAAAIKTNGETLVRNGEGSITYIFGHLNSEEWGLFFKKKN